MYHATQENGQDRTDTPEVRPAEGHAPYISRRPSWAENVSICAEAIDYTWTAPTVPEGIEPDGEAYPVRVEVTRSDQLYVNDHGVVLDEGTERIFLIDANFDVENARKLAAAIVECCDRLEGTEGHTVWCDPEAHAKLVEEMPGEDTPCVGREHYVSIEDRDLGGWWRQDVDKEPRFDMEWGGRFVDLDAGNLLSLYTLFLRMSWEDVNRVATMLGEAIDDFEGGDAWRDSLNL